MKRFGVLLDCSRNAVMKPEELKKLILFLEKAGYNCLELYTEDTYELEGEPRFGYLRGRYTKAELKELDAFGKEHGVELIPCIETLGHLEKIFEWKEYAGICDCGGVLLAGEEKSYRLIEKMFAACAECFSSRTINIGMDEAHGLGLGQYLFRHGYEDRFGIFLGHLKRVSEIALKYGFTLVIWSSASPSCEKMSAKRGRSPPKSRKKCRKTYSSPIGTIFPSGKALIQICCKNTARFTVPYGLPARRSSAADFIRQTTSRSTDWENPSAPA